MRVEHLHGRDAISALPSADLCLAFGSGAAFARPDTYGWLRDRYPRALIAGCSTAGEIVGASVYDDSLVAAGICFDHTEVRMATGRDGEAMARELMAPRLTHILVFADGLSFNGSKLAEGLRTAGVPVSGGLAGDGTRMRETFVLPNAAAVQDVAVAIGFYGTRLRASCGSMGGWSAFGPERVITRCDGNILHELDGRPAIDIYREYLGEHAAGLPASGLLFPLAVRPERASNPTVRSLIGIDEATGGITFAGDLPNGGYAQLMHASGEGLVDGAYHAARMVAPSPDLSLLISCVGRRAMLKQRIEDELECVQDVLRTPSVGFYSYGELAPGGTRECELHNQTMTITTFTEI